MYCRHKLYLILSFALSYFNNTQEILYEMYSEDMSISESGSQSLLVNTKRKTTQKSQDVEYMLEKALDDSNNETDEDSTLAYI